MHICILSRKDLQRISRVVRQAKALSDAGHAVTVISCKRPRDELVATTPEVEYVEVTPNPWTLRFLLARRSRMVEKRAREKGRRRGLRRVAAAVGRPFRLALLVLPSAVLLRLPDERLSARIATIRTLDSGRILALFLNILAQRASSVSFAEGACEAMRGRSFDCCQAHDNYSLLAASRLAAQTGAALGYDAVEITEHRLGLSRSLFQRIVDRCERWEEARIFRRASFMITVGDGLADWYAKRYRIPRPLPVRNCRWFWEYGRRDQIRRDCGLGPDDRLVVWWGWAYPAQGLEVILETARYADPRTHFAVLSDVLPRWEGFFAAMRARAVELALTSRVHFLDFRDPNEFISYVSGADLGIIPRPTTSPNTYYSMPQKFMEMVMARVPLAISDMIDMRTLVERYGIGAVFDVEDPLDIALTLERMLEPNTQARMRASLMHAAQELCWENELERYVAIFDRLAAQRASGVSAPAPVEMIAA